MNGQPVSVVHEDKHDRHILNYVCDLYQRTNLIISKFRSCDSETNLDRLHKTYCMHMYSVGELWNLSCNYIKDYKVARRKIKRRIWNIPPGTNNNLLSNVTDNINTIITLLYCTNILRVKLLTCSVNSTFAANYQYLSFKFGLTEADWYTSLDHLLGKVKKKIALLLLLQPVLCGVLKELCDIHDNTSLCDIADKNDIVVLIKDKCIN